MSNYITIASLKAFKIRGEKVGEDLCEFDDDEIQINIDSAEQVVEKYTNDIFYPKTETNKFDGNGRKSLPFPPKVPYRLISITSITERDIGETVLETFVEGEDFFKRPFSVDIEDSYCGYPRRYFGRGGIWPQGQNNIHVAGVWGAATTPAAITRAVSLLALENCQTGLSKLTGSDIKEIEWPDLRIEYAIDTKEDNRQRTTGFPYVDRLLHAYVNFSSMLIGVAVPNGRSTYS